MWFTLAILFVVVMMFLTRGQWIPDNKQLDLTKFTSNIGKFLGMGLLVAFVLTFISDAIVIVPAGHRGVIFDRFKGVQSKQLNEGLNMVTPFIQEATLIDVRIQKGEFEASAASKDLQSVRTKVALNYNPIPDEVPTLFQTYGGSFNEKVVHPAVQEALKAVTARYTAEELITRREEVKNQIHDLLQKHMSAAHLKLVETYITDFEFSPDFAHAIEAKQIAEQQSLKAKWDLGRIKIEAEQKIAGSRAEAEGLRMQKDAITPQLVELRKIEAQKLAIEKWDGHMPNVMMGNSTPLLNLGQINPTGR